MADQLEQELVRDEACDPPTATPRRKLKRKQASHGSIFAKSALLWGRILRLLSTLATRDSYESDEDPAKPPEPSNGDKLKLRNVIKQRLQLAEQGGGDVLLSTISRTWSLLTSWYEVQIPNPMGT